MITCKTCEESKDESEFYGGCGPNCKACHRSKVKERTDRLNAEDPDWRRRELARCRKKSAAARTNGTASPQNPETKKQWRERNPEKYKAHCAVGNAIRDGRLIRQRCHCGRKAQAHHEDYSKPLEVRWLCSIHHAQDHVETRGN